MYDRQLRGLPQAYPGPRARSVYRGRMTSREIMQLCSDKLAVLQILARGARRRGNTVWLITRPL